MSRPIAALALLLWALPVAVQAQTPFERGKYLMETIVACGNCRTPQTPQGPEPGRELAGGTPFEEPFDVAYASNITPDKATGIGGWTDAQTWRQENPLPSSVIPAPLARAAGERVQAGTHAPGSLLSAEL